MPRKKKHKHFLIRLSKWEYWPMYLSNIPVFFFWIIQSIRSFDPAFFSAVNPGIHTGGFFGNPKSAIYKLIPQEYLPKTIVIDHDDAKPAHVLELMKEHHLSFPVIVKPDIGERGMNVNKVRNERDLKRALEFSYGDVLLQEYVDYPLEITILCYEFPFSGEQGITSVCVKEFLSVVGDGRRSIRELMEEEPRALLQIERLERSMDLSRIPSRGKHVRLESIGNHSRGTKFIDGSELIDEQLTSTMLSLLRIIPGVQYGRFDIRAKSLEDLKHGKNFKILELNGVNSEPVHIYDPDYTAMKAYRDLWKHWELMRRIAAEQKRNGVRSMSVSSGLQAFFNYLSYKRQVSNLQKTLSG